MKRINLETQNGITVSAIEFATGFDVQDSNGRVYEQGIQTVQEATAKAQGIVDSIDAAFIADKHPVYSPVGK